MFGDVVRELAPGYGEAHDDGNRTTSAWPGAGSAWPGEAAVWADGGDANGRADCSGTGLGTLSSQELKALVVELAEKRARAEGRYLAAVGELAARNGAQSTAHVLRDQTRMNCAQARSEARLAESLVSEGFTDTLEAMRAGEIHMSHAKVIAREAPKKHRRSESDFLELARAYPSDTIARHPLAYRSQQVEADLAAEAAANGLSPIDAELALQRHERSASLRMGDDGMWHLRGKFDFLTGRQLSGALQAAVRSMRRRHDDNQSDSSDEDAPTQAQFTADALCELVLGTGPALRAATSLIVVADYDPAPSTTGSPTPPPRRRDSPVSPDARRARHRRQGAACDVQRRLVPTRSGPHTQRKRRPTPRPRRTRRRLHRLRAHLRAHPSPPHRPLRERQPHRHPQPRLDVPAMPPKPPHTRPQDPYPTQRPTPPPIPRTQRHRVV